MKLIEPDKVAVDECVDHDPEVGGESFVAPHLCRIAQTHECDGRVLIDGEHEAVVERVLLAQAGLSADRDEARCRDDLRDTTGSERCVHDVRPRERKGDRTAHRAHTGVPLRVRLVGRFDWPRLAVTDDLADRETEPCPRAPVEQTRDIARSHLGTERPQLRRHVPAAERGRRHHGPPAEQRGEGGVSRMHVDVGRWEETLSRHLGRQPASTVSGYPGPQLQIGRDRELEQRRQDACTPRDLRRQPGRRHETSEVQPAVPTGTVS